MTTQPHDQFAKELLGELLAPFGEVKPDLAIKGERRHADLWFLPDVTPIAQRQELGLLGQMTALPCLLEPFRNAVDRAEIRNCLLKLLLLHSQLQRKAKRQKTTLREAELPNLWLLVPTASADLRKSFAAAQPSSWIKGVYLLPESYRSGLVVIHQLPKTADTLWLRLLGRGNVQKQAIQEFTSLSEAYPLRDSIGDILSSWRTTLEERDGLNEEEGELLMNLSPAYLQRKQEILEEGRQEGRQEGTLSERRITIENLLKVRFGALDEPLSAIIEPLLDLSPEEFTPLLLQQSREQLVDRFSR